MIRRILAAACCMLAGLPALSAEPPASTDLASELATVKSEVRTLSSNLTQTMERLNQVIERVSEQETQVGQLRSQLTMLTDQINEDLRRQQEILEAISNTDTTGRHIPRLSAAMQSSEFRQEMEQVVQQSLRSTGTLRITNRTNDFHRIFVNRTEYSLPAGEILTLQVPVGTVSTQLPGRDLKNWTVAAPRYEQSIEIVPESTTTVHYAARPAYPSTPLYYNPLPVPGSVVYYWP